MISYADWAFGILSGPAGWIWGALAAIGFIGLALFVSRARIARRGLWLAVVLVCGFALSGALVIPYALAASRHTTPDGPFRVQRTVVELPPSASSRYAVPIVMQIWFPASKALAPAATLRKCGQLTSLPLASAGGSRRLLLYMPHLTGLGDDNAARLTYLASYGYVVVAFNDIAQDNAVPAGAPEDQGGSLFTWRMTTQADYDHFLSLTDARVKRQAEKALSGLDRLAACANENVASPWSATIDYAHVGFLGYSFGGATAAEAAAMDPRIVAVASLDGALYGQAFAGQLAVPYLYVLSGRAQPAMKSMMSDDPQERYFARLDARDLRAQARLVARKGSAGIRVDGSPHTSFSDAALEPHLSRLWLFKNPIEFSNAVDLYTRDFFDARLRGQSPALVEKRTSPMPRVLTFSDMGMAQDGNLAWLPAQDAAGAPLP